MCSSILSRPSGTTISRLQSSLCRNSYQDDAPYAANQPNSYRDELRPFQRLYYDAQFGKVLFTNAFRTDYRFYFGPSFRRRWPTPFEFRVRDMVNLKMPLDQARRHWLIASDEVLTADDDYSPARADQVGHHWSAYKLTENRFSVYYRRSFPTHKRSIGTWASCTSIGAKPRKRPLIRAII